jgi:hypothetical protein
VAEPPPTERPELALRASDADRERIVEFLRGHCAEGRLDLEELEERMDLAYAARTLADLEPLTFDLPGTAGSPAVEPWTSREPSVAGPPTSWTVAALGGAQRKGPWRPARKGAAVAVMGGVDLDFREAEIDGPEVTVTAVALMGGVDIVVPEGVEVEMTGFAIMGGRDVRLKDVPRRPGTPRIRVRAFAFMGGIDVKSRPPRRERSGRWHQLRAGFEAVSEARRARMRP